MTLKNNRAIHIKLAGIVRYIGQNKPFRVELRKNIQRSPLHSHSYFEIEIVVSGKGKSNINGKEYSIKNGSVSCIAPTDFHDINTTEPIELWHLSILDIPEEAEEIFGGTERLVNLKQNEFEKVCSLLSCIENEQQNPVNDGVSELCYNAILRIIVRSFSSPAKRLDPIFSAISYIRLNFCEKITESDIAIQTGYSYEHLSRKFKKVMGIGIKQYITSLRLSYAIQLLNTTNMTMTDVAFESGFGSYASFYRAFIQETGNTPTVIKFSKF